MTKPEVEEWSADLEGQVCGTAERRSRMVISWSTLRDAGVSDPEYSDLLYAVTHDAGDEVWDAGLRSYRASREKFSSVDSVVMYDGRVVVPSVLRGHVLTTLHRTHQGKSGMCLRAQAAVWWPGYTVDIQRVRDACLACGRNTPTPPVRPPVWTILGSW